jgi:hypothetical protein
LKIRNRFSENDLLNTTKLKTPSLEVEVLLPPDWINQIGGFVLPPPQAGSIQFEIFVLSLPVWCHLE